MLGGEKPTLQNGFSEISRCKKSASSRAEMARGWFGSNKVSELANMFSSRKLDICLQRRITVC